MTITFNHFKTRVVRYPLIAIGITSALLFTGMNEGLKQSEWAVWVQSIGATVGLGIAIYIPYRQRKDAIQLEETRQANEAQRVQMSIKDELQALQKTFNGPNISHLLKIEDPGIFDRHITIPIQRFPIYASLIDRLTLIEDDALRSDIIHAFAVAKGLISYAQQNNQLLTVLSDIETELHYRPDAFQYERKRMHGVEMIEMCRQMQGICRETIRLVDALVAKL
ncbi:hypothetical protein [Janthinobacterium sp. NKUCC06_STL]|uniref:hypothetical protein n=1 Tax=Janthinobacterium sp. NKUCC06_STL TaxID=2842127 RepID=UPI001C5AACFF|nr:hypothetical protein [Janthinobacterium sp. NKUCC06_STL]MBW3512901.1 hypothetical protein [Janthinobacterium sp. NKUCC06_STL]